MTVRAAVFVVVALCAGAGPSGAQQARETLAGRQLEDAIRVLQMRGLRVVFSSKLVTPAMRVRVEPRARGLPEQLEEVLRPHGLTAEAGPAGILQIVRLRRPSAAPLRGAPPPLPPPNAEANAPKKEPAATEYQERVTVVADLTQFDDAAVSSTRRLVPDELSGFASRVVDDPLRVVQTLPGVATGDDFRSEYSVRGSPYRHAGVVIDGIAAPWLQHAALGRGDTGTVTMLGGDVVDEAALLVGAYPRLDSSQLGPQLNVTLREGSRAARRFALGVSGTTATLIAEGPIGRSARGSWLLGVRRSHSEWPTGRSDEEATVFGFSDLQSKLAYDVRPGQQVSLTVVAGLSNVEREDPAPFAMGDGINRAAMMGLAWRSVIGSRTVITQRVSSLTHDFFNRSPTAGWGSRGADGAHAYRIDLIQPLWHGVIDAGAQLRHLRGSRYGAMKVDKSWL
jgi:hypothetical protein